MSAEAAEKPEEAARSDRSLCLVFHAGGQAFALKALEVHKVVEPGRINRLPRLPGALLGITHHRGRIITVVDLCGLLFEPRPLMLSAASRILILERAQRHIGLFVDSVAQIAPLRLPGNGQTALQHQEQPLTALDAERLLKRVHALTGEESA